MPIPFLTAIIQEGTGVIPYYSHVKVYVPLALTILALKKYFAGASNTWTSNFHGRVYIVTGGTAGLGASVVDELAANGAQIVLLVRNTKDEWLVDHIENLREKHGNQLIYAEECDLALLHLVRLFASSWLNSRVPRRLDGIIMCAGESLPMGKPREFTEDGVERQIGVNFLGPAHLLELMAPALRSQPADRRVRVLVATCLLQAFGKVDYEDLLWEKKSYPVNKPWQVFGTSKLLLACYAREYQRRMDLYVRSDKTGMDFKINMVNPGVMRLPLTKRFLSFGQIWGLIMYMVVYPILWIFLKSTYQGAQSFLYGLSNIELDLLPGGIFLQECSVVEKKAKKELYDEELQKKVYDQTAKLIEAIEKESARKRAKSKKKNSKKEKKQQKTETKKEDLKIGFMSESEKQLIEELGKMEKMPLVGDSKTLVKDNKYLKELDEKFAKSRQTNKLKETSAVPQEKPQDIEKKKGKKI